MFSGISLITYIKILLFFMLSWLDIFLLRYFHNIFFSFFTIWSLRVFGFSFHDVVMVIFTATGVFQIAMMAKIVFFENIFFFQEAKI